MAPFPHEAVPDGTVWVFHHFTYPLLFAYLVCNWLRDNTPEREPKYVDVGIHIALIGFLLAWPFYHAFGALLALAGVLVACYGLLVHDLWREYPRKWRAFVGLCLLLAIDDWLSHALGVWTPADWLFNAVLVHLIS